MSLQNPRVFTASFVTGASTSSGIDLGGGFLYVSIEVPGGTLGTTFGVASTPIYVLGAATSTGTYRRMTEILTSTVNNDFNIASSVSNRMVPVPYFNFRFIKLEASGTVTGAVVPAQFNIICSDSL